MDFNQIHISNSPMYALPVNQLLAKSNHLNVFNNTFYTVGRPFSQHGTLTIDFYKILGTQTTLIYEASVKV